MPAMRWIGLALLPTVVALGAACSNADQIDLGGGGAGPGAGGASASGSGGGAISTGSTGGGDLTSGPTSTGAGASQPDGGAHDCSNPLDQAGCSCVSAGETRACYTGPAGSQGKGTCKDGTQTCVADGEFAEWGPCTGDVLPTAEVCSDTLDHNCNGLTGCDDAACVGLSGCCAAGQTRPCYDGPAGTEGVGACHGGTQTCDAQGAWQACTGEALPGSEVGHCADGVDNDCNGLTDCQEIVCLFDPHCQPKVCTAGATEACYDGPAGTAGVGPCKAGTHTCNADGSGWGLCTGEVTPTAEGGHCADGVDNDCSGKKDCADPVCATASNCCVPSSGNVDGTVWANSSTTLYRIDPTTFSVTTVGNFNSGDQMTDIAVSTTGALYGISFTTLYAINKTTGAASAIADLSSGNNNSLTFLANGNLLAADGSGNLKTVNPSSGTVTTMGNFGDGLVSSGDLVAVSNGTMYGISSTKAGGGDASASNVLLRVDVASGVATVVGPIGHGSVWGLAYSQAQVIGFTTFGEILRIDPQTGTATTLAQTGIAFYGAAQSPLVAGNACP